VREQVAPAGHRFRGGLLELVTGIGEAIDTFVARRQPPVRAGRRRDHAKRVLQYALRVGVPASGGQHSGHRQPGTLVERVHPDRGLELLDALVELGFCPVDEAQDAACIR
jgi:hypothetical protein